MTDYSDPSKHVEVKFGINPKNLPRTNRQNLSTKAPIKSSKFSVSPITINRFTITPSNTINSITQQISQKYGISMDNHTYVPLAFRAETRSPNELKTSRWICRTWNKEKMEKSYYIC